MELWGLVFFPWYKQVASHWSQGRSILKIWCQRDNSVHVEKGSARCVFLQFLNNFLQEYFVLHVSSRQCILCKDDEQQIFANFIVNLISRNPIWEKGIEMTETTQPLQSWFEPHLAAS